MKKALSVTVFLVCGVLGTSAVAQRDATKGTEATKQTKTKTSKTAFRTTATMKVTGGKDFTAPATVYVDNGQACSQEGATDTNTYKGGHKFSVTVPGGATKQVTCDIVTTFECKDGAFAAVKAELLNCAFDDPVYWNGTKIIDRVEQ